MSSTRPGPYANPQHHSHGARGTSPSALSQSSASIHSYSDPQIPQRQNSINFSSFSRPNGLSQNPISEAVMAASMTGLSLGMISSPLDKYDTHPQFFSTPMKEMPNILSRSSTERTINTTTRQLPTMFEREEDDERRGEDKVTTVRFDKENTVGTPTGMAEPGGEGYTNLKLVYSVSHLEIFRAQSKPSLSPVWLKISSPEHLESLARLRHEWSMFSSIADNSSSSSGSYAPTSTVTSPGIQPPHRSLSSRTTGLGHLQSYSSSSSYTYANLAQHPGIISPILMDYFPDGSIALVYDDKKELKTAKEWFLPELPSPTTSTLDFTATASPSASTTSIASTPPKPRTQNDLVGILTVVANVVDVLAAIHRLGIIHNNINPYSVNISPGSPPRGYLTGWHLSTRHEREDLSTSNDTGQSPLPGSFRDHPSPLQYIAPECTGRMNRTIDFRADFYSLGVMMYELCVGYLPFRSTEPLELIHQHIAKPPAVPAEVNQSIPPAISKIILKLLEKNAEERYQTASGLKADLDALLYRLTHGLPLDDYEIGLLDASSQFVISDKLYGRESVLRTLYKCYQQTRMERSSLMVLIGGSSGSGKSRLVQEIQKRVVKNQGYFTSGKFDQYKRSSSIFSLIQVLQDLVRQVLSESRANLQRWRVDAIRAFDGDAAVLTEVIPELKVLLGSDYTVIPVSILGPVEREQRFRAVYLNFLSIFARQGLVVFLDDLQWCSHADFSLITAIAQSAEQTYQESVLLIGAYRNNEVGDEHPLERMSAKLREKGTGLVEVEIGDLDMASVGKIVADTLRRSGKVTEIPSSPAGHVELVREGSPVKETNLDTELRTLTELVYARTSGNAFFVTQLLRSLHRGGHIWFDFDERLWRFSLTTLEADELPETVVDLLVNQMMKLGKETREVMKYAACLGGDKLDLDVLAVACGKERSEVGQMVAGALNAGLLLPVQGNFHLAINYETMSQPDGAQMTPYIANRYPAVPAEKPTRGFTFRFLHDRVQQAAYSLIPENEIAATHRAIGLRLLASTREEDLDGMLYEITNHLNYWVDSLNRVEMEKLVELNYRAGRNALEATAFSAALGYFKQAKKLLDEYSATPIAERTTMELKEEGVSLLVMNINLALADAFFASSLYNDAIITAETLFAQCVWPINKARCLLIKMKCLMALGRLLDTICPGFTAMALLGHNIPLDEEGVRIHRDTMRQQTKVDTIDVRSLADMKPETRKDHKTDILLHEIASVVLLPIYMSSPTLLASVCYTSFAVTQSSGLCIESAYPILMLGVHIGTEGGEKALRRGWEFGQASIGLVERCTGDGGGTVPTNAPGIYEVFAGHIAVFNQGMGDVMRYLDKAVTAGQAVFDVDYTCFAAAEVPTFGMWSGERLDAVHLKMTSAKSTIERLRARLGLLFLQMPFQVLLNLRGLGNSDPTVFEGEEIPSETVLELKNSESLSHVCLYWMYRSILAVLFNKTDLAVSLITNQIMKVEASITNTLYQSLSYFYGAVAMIDTPNLTMEQQTWLDKAVESIRQYSVYAKSTYLHKYVFLLAELNKSNENLLTTLDRFEEAISLANGAGMAHDAAFMNERCALWLSAISKKRSVGYLKEAYRLYSWWGATAKLAVMRSQWIDELGLKSRPVLSRNVSENTAAFSIGSAVTGLAGVNMPLSPHTSRVITMEDDDRDSRASRDDSSEGQHLTDSDLDLKTFMKASLYISEGVKMDEVIVKLMRSVLQTAGADYGVLILEEDGELYAETILFMEKVTILEHQLLENRPDLMPVSIAQIVWKLGEPIVRNGQNEKFDGTYGRDAYFSESRRGVKSVLCMPIKNQIKTMGVLYLENKHVNHAFTSQRLELLNLLCTQAAVTIDKARLYRAMEIAKKAAEEATEEKGSFLANMSHEIRTPFNALLSCSIFLLDTVLSEEQREYVETIRNSAVLTLKIIDGILDFSKMEHGSIDFQVAPFSLRDCIESALQLVAEPAATKDLELVFENRCPEIEVVFGDVTRFRQIIINLCGNAVKFTETGHILVTTWEEKPPLSEGNDAEDWRVVHVTVEDTGIGIPSSAKDKLFRAFSQVDSSTRRLYGGSGLGLAISRKLAQTMGGDINMNSIEGSGSTFHLTILAQVGVKEYGKDPRFDGKTLIVADTHDLSSKILAAELTREGLNIIRTDSAASTLSTIQESTPSSISAVIFDLTLDPSLSVVNAIGKADKNIGIIIQSRFGSTVPQLESFPNVVANIIRPAPRAKYVQYIQSAVDTASRMGPGGKSRSGNVIQMDQKRELMKSLGQRHPLHILLAEDNPLNTKVALQHLKRIGYTATHAKDGIEVLELCEAATEKQQMYDVILMDVMMPRSDGIETSLELRKRYKDEERPLIIALTANATSADVERCIQAGMGGHIAKPINPEVLAGTLMGVKRLEER